MRLATFESSSEAKLGAVIDGDEHVVDLEVELEIDRIGVLRNRFVKAG